MNSYPGFDGLGITIIAIVLILFIVPKVFYLLTMQNTLKTISPENRRMQPSHVWFMMIPIFSIIWHFIIVSKISESLRLEFLKRNVRTNEAQPGYTLGIVTCALACGFIIPLLNIFTGIASFVCWIIYWIKISEFKKILERTDVLDEGLNFDMNI